MGGKRKEVGEEEVKNLKKRRPSYEHSKQGMCGRDVQRPIWFSFPIAGVHFQLWIEWAVQETTATTTKKKEWSIKRVKQGIANQKIIIIKIKEQ